MISNYDTAVGAIVLDSTRELRCFGTAEAIFYGSENEHVSQRLIISTENLKRAPTSLNNAVVHDEDEPLSISSGV